MITRILLKTLSPIAYSAMHPLVFVLTALVAPQLPIAPDEHNAVGVLVATALVLGSAIFAWSSIEMCRLERLARPTVFDHLRHCALMYALVASVAMVPLGAGLADPEGVDVLWKASATVAAISIVVNATTLLVFAIRRRRQAARVGDVAHRSPGGAPLMQPRRPDQQPSA